MPRALAAVACLIVLAACSDDEATSGTVTPTQGSAATSLPTDTSRPPSPTPDPTTTLAAVDVTGRCEVGEWVSTSLEAPSQAAIGDITPTGGGDGMDITFGPDNRFQIDFGPMNPATASFTTADQEGTLSTSFKGVGEGQWTVADDGLAVAPIEDFDTVTALVTLTLGETVPPIFDETLQQLNDNRMLDDELAGVFTVTSCEGDQLTMASPFPGGDITITAARKG
jgi:hypothetical protein